MRAAQENEKPDQSAAQRPRDPGRRVNSVAVSSLAAIVHDDESVKESLNITIPSIGLRSKVFTSPGNLEHPRIPMTQSTPRSARLRR
jgi:hypothetical protein